MQIKSWLEGASSERDQSFEQDRIVDEEVEKKDEKSWMQDDFVWSEMTRVGIAGSNESLLELENKSDIIRNIDKLIHHLNFDASMSKQ